MIDDVTLDGNGDDCTAKRIALEQILNGHMLALYDVDVIGKYKSSNFY